jgi:glycosyltransferase involved in cell wall biosynthesis
MMANEIKQFNPNAILHWHNYPLPEIKPLYVEKKFDIVFFAQVSKDKGIEDLLKAISIVKPHLPYLKVCIIGATSSSYSNFLMKMTTQLGVFENIYWAGFLDSQADVHRMASFSKISVLPTWHDILPGTIIESMLLKLPVVAYSVGGIPEINSGEEYISLVPQGDVNTLAKKILFLLTNPESLKSKSENSYKRAIVMFDNTKITGDLLNAYKEVVHEFKKK